MLPGYLSSEGMGINDYDDIVGYSYYRLDLMPLFGLMEPLQILECYQDSMHHRRSPSMTQGRLSDAWHHLMEATSMRFFGATVS